jgi:hypothetical protein
VRHPTASPEQRLPGAFNLAQPFRQALRILLLQFAQLFLK